MLPLAGVPCALLERDAGGNTSETAFLHWLREYVVRTGPWRLIAFDPLSRFGGPDVEKDNAQGTRFIQALESMATLTGATVLFTHHTTKAPAGESGRGGRGSSSIFDGCRWEATLEPQKATLDDPDARDRLGETRRLRASLKSNYSRKAEPLVLRREDGGPLVPLDDGERETARKALDIKTTKAESKRPEREQREAEKAARDAAKKAEKTTQAAAETAARHSQEEATLAVILRGHAGALTVSFSCREASSRLVASTLGVHVASAKSGCCQMNLRPSTVNVNR